MRNIDYVRGMMDWLTISPLELRQELQEVLLAILDSYGERHWWEREDAPDLRALYQTHEEFLCMPYADYQRELHGLLDREIWTIELTQRDKIMAEARAAYVQKHGALPDDLRWSGQEQEQEGEA